MILSPTTIIMTATIKPNDNTPLLTRIDPKIRMSDYKDALKFYIECSNELIDRIIFVDNSNTNLTEINEFVHNINSNKIIELISFDGNNHSPTFGKGYGEFKLLDYGIEQTKLLHESDTFWKVTGRLKILNIEKLILSAPKNYELYCDLRDVPFIGHKMGGNQWMDMRVFSCTKRKYNDIFKGIYPELNQSLTKMSPEQYIFPRIKNDCDKSSYKRFKVQPKFAGFGGHKNVSYRSSQYLFKEKLRSITRTFFPGIWL